MQNLLDQAKPHFTAASEASHAAAQLAISQVERASQLAVELSKSHAEFSQEQVSAAYGLKDLPQVFQYVQSQLEASAARAAEVANEAFELSQKFQAEIVKLAEAQFDNNQAEVNKLVAQALKNAPAGSEAAVAAVQQAVEAGNKALAEARKHAKQAAKLAQDSVEQVKSKAVLATKKPAARRRG